ncbi:hypothetical protein [Ruminiclostridium papyrosolvens]|uniref:Ribbon-helix-helix protein CopG domain-containing protein n=1 Tax=Ruminiclostridium papyrosolvens C7 TaxID=1330534 RepID=U4R630_9FIRM|nr:hypothetical protein [Ruminiclostridium papyrosolvens]EPR13907.1 hypothetical protein L323_02235 [Ruminiclostridium papyrosolvens C7]
MAKRKTNPEELKRSIRFKAKSIEDMKKLAAVRGISVSDIVREFVESNLENYRRSFIFFVKHV